MAQVVISNTQHQLFTLRTASNIKWRKSLNGIGYASFDLPLTDALADPQWIHAGNYVHIYRDGVPTTSYAAADWGGVLENDYEINPKDGAVTVSAAGLAQLLQLSIVTTTTTYTNIDVGSIVESLIANRDNKTVNLTAATVSGQAQQVTKFVAGWGDAVMADITKLCTQYGCDFEVKPDFTWAFYNRQGVDNPNLVCRYDAQGNIALDTRMHLVNSEMANQIWAVGQSASVFVADPSAAQYYGKKTLVVQYDDQSDPVDIHTRAQLELAKRKYPLFALDNIQMVDSSLFPFYKVELGDRVQFETPNLPFLKTFNGLQRILAIDYDDHNRLMNLTLGNTVYVVLRGKLHELRLYN